MRVAGNYKRLYKIALIAALVFAIGLIVAITLFLTIQKQSYSRLVQLNINNTHTIEEKNELIARLTDEADALNQTIGKQNDTIRQQNDTINQQSETIKKLNSTIAQLNNTI